MWLLSTARAELQHFASPKQAAEAGFAILSHVWNEKEQTFQETQALAAQCDADHSNPRDRSTPKVRQSCEFAENQDFDWIWNDACCIDKTSSSELSEAINSMFTYYSLAEVCYAYLEDVPSADNSIASYRQLRSSRWFRRGWTLQELIAPDQVLFLSRDWTAIGTKAELSATLETITKIPIPVLRSPENIRNYSIAQRMSWAAERETTREEDEAYCLMGIFDINMPALYGEGRNAFQRLQEEIMKKSVDTSLFAWGGLIKGPHFNHTDFSPYDNAVFGDNPCVYLLARSPSAFLLSSLYEYDTDTLVRLDALPQQHSKLRPSRSSRIMRGFPSLLSSRMESVHTSPS
ncbi:heterokaryon incompatibility protein-domain-containing protein [Daedaleopsis nitida]|nr:heterokaryon incompatibility protein-domain-containing protein [Daedaleopsis nitida]